MSSLFENVLSHIIVYKEYEYLSIKNIRKFFFILIFKQIASLLKKNCFKLKMF